MLRRRVESKWVSLPSDYISTHAELCKHRRFAVQNLIFRGILKLSLIQDKKVQSLLYQKNPEHHRDHLRHVYLKEQCQSDGVGRACLLEAADFLDSEKQWSGFKMLALMRSGFPEIDNDRFKSVMTISADKSMEQKKDRLNIDENTSKTLQLLRVKGFPRLLPEGILALVNYCRYLRELSLSYALLSDELLIALSSEQQVRLETLRVEAHPEAKPLPRVSEKAWTAFSSHLPNINLVLLSYMTEEDDQNPLFTSYIPVTHLFFGEAPSEATVLRIGHQCPRLTELVIAAYGPGLINEPLIFVAQGCPRLSAIGLGDCELTCSGFVEFVTQCAQRLRVLYVWETSLIEDSEFDIPKASAKVSLLLGRTWVPEYIPPW